MPWGGMRVGGRTPSSSSLPISVVPWHSGSCLTRVRPLTKPLHLLPRLTSLSSRGGWRVRVPPIRQGRRLSSPFPSSVPSAMTHPDLAPPPPPSWDCVAECGGVHASGVTASWVPRALLGTRVDPPCIGDTGVPSRSRHWWAMAGGGTIPCLPSPPTSCRTDPGPSLPPLPAPKPLPKFAIEFCTATVRVHGL